jgi:hypothetical protein
MVTVLNGRECTAQTKRRNLQAPRVSSDPDSSFCNSNFEKTSSYNIRVLSGGLERESNTSFNNLPGF